MYKDTALVWLGTYGSAFQYLEDTERADRMAMVDPSVMMKTRDRFDAGEARFGPYTEDIQVIDKVAIIPIHGSMRAKESWMSMMFGITTYDGISNMLATIVADGGIETVLLDIDSPGGEAKGLDVATEAIQATIASGINVVSHTAGQMASAAYWIGSAAQQVAASETAEVGSVGVIAVHGEASERNKKEGLTYTVLRKGEYKALASPYEKLSDKARAQLDDQMERKYQQFIGAVSDQRQLPKEFVSENIATGKLFDSSEALNLGMIDEVIAYNDLVSRYVSAENPQAAVGAGNSSWSEAAMHKQPIVNASAVSPEEAAIAVAAGADPKTVIPAIDAKEDEQENVDELAEVNVVESSAEETETVTEAEQETNEPATPAEDTSALSAMVGSLNDQLVETKVQVKELEAEVTALKAGNAGLRQIAVEQTQRLRVALGQSDDVSDLGLMSDAALVTAHRQNLTQFMERFSAGAVSRTPESDPTPPIATVTRLGSAVKKATQIK